MARSKEFDEERALAAAMDVFWRKGYEKTSLEALMREMGIARQSLYDTFGDKRALYLKAMAFYRERTNSSLRQSLSSAPTVKEGFTKVLLGLVAESREQHARGCLLLSANMERAVDDEEIARFLEENQAEVESILVDALRRGQQGGELGGRPIRARWRNSLSRRSRGCEPWRVSNRTAAPCVRLRGLRSRCSIDERPPGPYANPHRAVLLNFVGRRHHIELLARMQRVPPSGSSAAKVPDDHFKVASQVQRPFGSACRSQKASAAAVACSEPGFTIIVTVTVAIWIPFAES